MKRRIFLTVFVVVGAFTLAAGVHFVIRQWGEIVFGAGVILTALLVAFLFIREWREASRWVREMDERAAAIRARKEGRHNETEGRTV